MLRKVMKMQCEKGILIIATNDNDDVRYVDRAVSVEKGGSR
jgi:hypothetical protein